MTSLSAISPRTSSAPDVCTAASVGPPTSSDAMHAIPPPYVSPLSRPLLPRSTLHPPRRRLPSHAHCAYAAASRRSSLDEQTTSPLVPLIHIALNTLPPTFTNETSATKTSALDHPSNSTLKMLHTPWVFVLVATPCGRRRGTRCSLGRGGGGFREHAPFQMPPSTPTRGLEPRHHRTNVYALPQPLSSACINNRPARRPNARTISTTSPPRHGRRDPAVRAARCARTIHIRKLSISARLSSLSIFCIPPYHHSLLVGFVEATRTPACVFRRTAVVYPHLPCFLRRLCPVSPPTAVFRIAPAGNTVESNGHAVRISK
ncbi:hypothetical protein R3P38DRAFT_3202555 [Favolaschia claudopus]|uniref:Uncharacterized protein n=1 Tax=Favolaschia claudopus TaxID=2862362 RepID=A0AAW0AW68_9AGAR